MDFPDISNALGLAQQHYRLDIPQARSASQADVLSFTGTKAIGEPTRCVVRFTHPRDDLSRTEYQNKPATLIFEPKPQRLWSAPVPAQRIQGVITDFAQLGSSEDETTYEVVLESRLALLRNGRKCRFFLDKSDPEIIRTILRENGFDQLLADVEMDLFAEYRKREFVMQWGEDDLAFLTRLCERSGIWFTCETGKHCERVRFGDYFRHYRRDESLTVPFHAQSSLSTSGAESVQTLEMRATSIPQTHTVRTYSPERLTSDLATSSKVRHNDDTAYGESYVWGTPYLTEDQAQAEAQLRHEAAQASQVQYSGTGDVYGLTAGAVLKLSNRDLADAKHGILVTRVNCRASRRDGYQVDFVGIPSDRIYRLPLREDSWPSTKGAITGTIAAPDRYGKPYLDEQGRYIVHLHPDREKRTKGLESCPMRLAKPFAGPGQTGFHFGLVGGAVVTVDFLWGCLDLPYIAQVLHTAEETDPVVAGHPWGTRNTIRTRTNNTFEMEDREGHEHIKLATEHGKTQLNLGHTVDRSDKTRGGGFELRTDLKGHVRAGGGMLIAADPQTQAKGEQAEMRAVTDQLEKTQSEAQELAKVALAAQAEVADVKAENRWLKDELAGLKKAVIAISAPNGIGLATPERVLVSAGKDVSVASSQSFNTSAVKNIVMAAGQRLSFFAHKLGIKLFAARGKVQISAHSDGVDISSDKDTTITSSNGRVVIEAKEELLLKCGGSYLRLYSGGIEDGTKGSRDWRAGSFNRSGPASVAPALPVLPVPAEGECALKAAGGGSPFTPM